MGPMIQTLAIVGVGLIGGSLARCVKERGLAARIVGLGRGERNLRRALELGVIDVMETDLARGVSDADVVVLATPVTNLAAMLARTAALVRPGAVVTDVGSVKVPIVREAESRFPRPCRFVGGHPVAGTEHSGVEASFAGLFQNRKCILTPTERTDPQATRTVADLWRAVGSQVVTLDADVHDRVMGFVSHLPHLVAYALVNTIRDAESREGNLLDFTAGGFRDFTRIASSHPEMWRDICVMNRDALLEALQAFSRTIEELRRLVSARNGEGLEESFRQARQLRDCLPEGNAARSSEPENP